MSDLHNSAQSVSKIKIKLENIAIDFEGSEDYIRSDLPNLLEILCTYAVPLANETKIESDVEEVEELPANPDPTHLRLEMTTNTISAKLKVTKGTELVLAACAHLCLVKGADTFARKNILAEMQTASNYYKQTYCKNLSQSLSSLVKDNKLIERSKDNYALTAKARQELEATIV